MSQSFEEENRNQTMEKIETEDQEQVSGGVKFIPSSTDLADEKEGRKRRS